MAPSAERRQTPYSMTRHAESLCKRSYSVSKNISGEKKKKKKNKEDHDA